MTLNHRLLILGAGRGQVGLIRAAQRMGLDPYVASLPSSTAPGLAMANRVVPVDISDADAVQAVAQELRITGVVTSCADTGVVALGRVCDELNLPGLSERAARRCADKALMKTAFAEAGVRTPKSREIASREDLYSIQDRLAYPVIVKAVDLQGSQGIMIARTSRDLEAAYEVATSATRRDIVLIEEFLEGTEFGAQAMIHNGSVKFVLSHNDQLFYAPTPVPVGHSVPLDNSPEFNEMAKAEVVKAINAVGLDNCAVNVDLISKDGEIFVIEITGRAGANGLCEMTSRYFGTDYYEDIIRIALGIAPRSDFALPRGEMAVAVGMLYSPHARGIITKLDFNSQGLDAAECLFFKGTGERMNGFSHSGDCFGQVCVSSQTLRKAQVLLWQAELAVDLRVIDDGDE